MQDNSRIVVGEVNHQSRLYTFSKFIEPDSFVLLTHVDDSSRLWHVRFVHLNFRYMQQLNKKGMVVGLPNIHFSKGVCEGCVLGKHPQEKFEKGKAHRASSPLDLIHSDLMGPFMRPSISKARYVLIFLDDYSRYTWVFFLRLKPKVFEHLKEFKALVETQSGTRIKSLRTDNGGEYVNKNVQNLCLEARIQLQHTVPYTPQQNGVVEWKNGSLKEMASCMLHARSLPPKLWVEALNCANHIQNKSPHIFIKDMTHFEAWSGNKPEVTHFRVFDSRAWADIPSEKRKALDPQRTACIFVRYPDDVKGYRLIHPSTDQLIIERSVQFEESLSHAPHEPHAGTFVLPPIRDDESAHSESTSNLSSDTESKDSEHADAQLVQEDEEPQQRPKLTQTTLQDARDLVGDPADLRRTRCHFKEPPRVLTATKPMLTMHCYVA
jgi:hypothetical protein